MASIDSLPADQRAVLQLILQRGRTFDEIARLLSINPESVRERAHAALDALGPQTRVAPERRVEIADYLLGQLPADRAAAARESLAQSASERAWARVLSAELAPIASGPLPGISLGPAESPPGASPTPTPAAPPAATPDPEAAPEGKGRARRLRRGRGERAEPAPRRRREPRGPRRERRSIFARRRSESEPAAVAAPPPPEPRVPDVPPAGEERRISRFGGAILIGGVIVLAAVLAIVLLSSGGGSSSSSSSAASASSPAPTTTTSASSSGATSVIAQINLSPPAGHGRAAGIAEVLRQGSTKGVAIVAQHLAPNSTKPPNAYAVWLYNSAADARILGFANPGVGKNGRLSTAGSLPSDASHFKRLIVTVETSASPKAPGQIVLEGKLTGV